MAKGLNETKVDVAGLIRTIAVRGQDVGEDKGGYINDVHIDDAQIQYISVNESIKEGRWGV